MHPFIRRRYLSIFLVLMLSACTEMGSQGTVDVVQDLRKTNLDSNQFPWIRGLAHGKTKRWDIEHDGLIPVKLNGSTLAKDAIGEIEAALHMSIFETTSIVSAPDNLITRGIIVSGGTAIGPNGTITKSTCGHVSALPQITSYPKEFYDTNGRINTRLYVNLSSKKCTASLEIAIHEFGHALGLGNHFPGFGSGDIISPSFWQVLYTLYHNEVGTSIEDLELQLREE